jgi:hypothetical protein
MTVSGKDKRGLVEQLRVLRTRLDRLEHRNAELVHVERELRDSLEQFKTVFDDSLVGSGCIKQRLTAGYSWPIRRS